MDEGKYKLQLFLIGLMVAGIFFMFVLSMQ